MPYAPSRGIIVVVAGVLAGQLLELFKLAGAAQPGATKGWAKGNLAEQDQGRLGFRTLR
ncbi:hypothetical protein [Micromonospora sp. WP24]|uniref:hypothetical protein n=1 Tax=Micromonospora sp. WP24 TaxID=2604469 RepID=UPI001651F0F7|nr:hypothetical protein [Micromonospora sp. WP24]